MVTHQVVTVLLRNEIKLQVVLIRAVKDTYLISTKILEVNLLAFAYRLFHEDFSSIDGAPNIQNLTTLLTSNSALMYLHLT